MAKATHCSVDYSPASKSFRDSTDGLTMPLTPEPGQLHLTPELISAFRSSLDQAQIDLRFIGGSWETFSTFVRSNSPYTSVITSETIYCISSLPILVEICKEASHGSKNCRTIVAAKNLYFGVGGGLLEFERDAQNQGGILRHVWSSSSGNGVESIGVARSIVELDWI